MALVRRKGFFGSLQCSAVGPPLLSYLISRHFPLSFPVSPTAKGHNESDGGREGGDPWKVSGAYIIYSLSDGDTDSGRGHGQRTRTGQPEVMAYSATRLHCPHAHSWSLISPRSIAYPRPPSHFLCVAVAVVSPLLSIVLIAHRRRRPLRRSDAALRPPLPLGARPFDKAGRAVVTFSKSYFHL